MVVKGQYPGGRPIKHPPRAKGNGSYNTPLDGYMTPRLRPPKDSHITAIGFTADICANDQDED